MSQDQAATPVDELSPEEAAAELGRLARAIQRHDWLYYVRSMPELSDELKRKKDHNRAEALLIAEYGRLHVWNSQAA